MKIEDAAELTSAQRQNISELSSIAKIRFLRIEVSDDQRKVLFLSASDGRLICSSPVEDFDD